MTIPNWADETLSRDLPVLRARGESQELEYKSEFPENTRDLGREIAAFASTNTGTILIGVSDSGDLIGLPGCDAPEVRDQIIRRLEGISKGTVKPSITPTAKFAIEASAVVLVIVVPKGTQPIYYSNNIPYVRHITQACPAEPHEVIERIAEFLRYTLSTSSEAIPDEKSQLYSELARILADVLVIVDEADERQINPWLDMWRSDFGYAASELRDLAVSSIAFKEELKNELKEIADNLDEVANMRLYLGSGNDLREGVSKVGKLALEILQRYFSDVPLTQSTLDQIRELIRTTALKLSELSSRSMKMVDAGRIEELQSQASNLAYPLARVTHYKIEPLGKDVKSKLYQIARTLHLTETMRLYMDGGLSMKAVIDRIEDCSKQLNQMSNEISN